ncbi:MAG: PhnD/SsuA/transferrin family substrate-binding protein, partial [Pseudomonadota bacterium]
FNHSPGYRAVAVRAQQPIRGIVVVRADSPLTSLEELSGETLAFPSPAAFAASVLPRAKLSSEAVDFTPKYVSSHDSVYLGVAKGLFAAGGGVKRTFNKVNPEIQKQLKVLWTSAAYTPHAIAAHPDISQEMQLKLQQALVEMYQDPQGKALLESLKIKKGLSAADDSDWDDVRSLGVGLLNQLIKQ